MVELGDAVVAEQVGVGEHDDPAGAVVGDRGERRVGDRGGRLGAGDHPGAVARAERAGAVEAGCGDPGEEVGAPRRAVGASAAVGEDPGGASPWWCS